MSADLPVSDSRPLLAITDLTAQFDARGPVLARVSLTVPAGGRVALVGESGSGKTVTALSAMRLIDDIDYVGGEIHFDGQDVLRLSPGQMRQLRGREIAMIFQEPMTALNPLKTVGAQIAEGVLLHEGGDKAAIQARVIELLRLTGLPDPEQRARFYPHQLSGGQRQRAMIAMALAGNPRLLIADEPTTALDVTLQHQIMDLLTDLQQRLGMALLLITHDLNLVRRYADNVVVMQHGRVVEQGAVEQVFAHPEHEYTRTLLASRPQRGELHAVDESVGPLVRAQGLGVTFGRKGSWWRKDSRFEALRQVDLYLRAGETLGIVGESGSGKSTLALALLKLIPAVGRIWLDEQSVDGLDSRAFRPFRRDLQVVFQDPFGALSPRMTIGEIVGEGLRVHEPQLDRVAQRERIAAALKEVGLAPDIIGRYPHEFSGGQRQRIAIARALILRPRVLILDEPTSALDATVQKQVIALLQRLQRDHGLSYLFITHDLAVVRAMAHRVMVLYQGEVVEVGDTESIFETPQAEYTRILVQASL